VSEARAIALVAPYCDLEERLSLVPPSATSRGLYFSDIEKQLNARGLLGPYREYFPPERYSALSFYPVRKFLVRIACAGSIVASPELIHDGMLLIGKGHAKAFIGSLLGKLMLRVLSGDPTRLMQQAMAGRRQSTTYGHWDMTVRSERRIEVRYQTEYVWIESALAGAGLGTFEACGIAVRMEHQLIDRFNGSTFYEW
jgi:uncharacterized protein (TIGR02265 family)